MYHDYIVEPQASEAEQIALMEQWVEGNVGLKMFQLEEAFGTEQFTSALADVANSSAIQGMAEVPATWRLACNIVPRNDFKNNHVKVANGMGLLTKRGEHEVTSLKKPTDRKEYYQIAVYDDAFELTMQAWANDETDILKENYRSWGQAATHTLNDFMWNLILGPTTGVTMPSDSTALFTSGHANYTSSGGTLAIATLQAAITGMINQTDEAGTQKMSRYPRYLFCNPAEYYLAKQLTMGPSLLGSTTVPSLNPMYDFRITPVVVPELTATHWMLGADPVTNPCVEMGFFEGKVEPTIYFLRPDSDTTFWKRTRASKCELIFGGIPKAWTTFFKAIP